MKVSLLIGLIFFVSKSCMISQIAIYPQAIFLNNQNRSNSIKVMNLSDESKEIMVDLEYGYISTDSLGKTFVNFSDTLTKNKYSAVPFVQVFPKKIVVKSKEDQIFKFILNGNISKAEDGTYFGRVKFLSRNPIKLIDSSYNDKIKTEVEIQFSMIAALFVQKGKKECNLKVVSEEVYVDSTNVNVLVGFEREGNSPFLGRAEISIYNDSGTRIANSVVPSPIYFNSKKAFSFDRILFKNEIYKVDLTLTNKHDDIPKEFSINVKPVNVTFNIDLNGILK